MLKISLQTDNLNKSYLSNKFSERTNLQVAPANVQ